MSTTHQTSAAAVSAALRRGGLNPLGSGASRMREGIRVSNGWTKVRVGFDVDNDGIAMDLRLAAESILAAAGYETERSPDSFALLVSRSEV